MMLEHMKKFAGFGLILASVTVPIIMSPAGIRSNLDWEGMSDSFMQSQKLPENLYKLSDISLEKLKKHIRDVADDMIRLEYM